jgi:hypothetical protein
MRKQYWNTLVAIVFLGALWAGFRFYDRRKAREAEKTESKPAEKILAVESDHIRSFTLKPRDGEAFTCTRDGKSWVISEPRKLAVDQTAVSSWLGNLTSATIDDVVDAHPSNLKDYGLDPPASLIEVSTETKPEQLTLRLGDQTPTSSGIYAQIAGNPRVVSLPSYDKSSLEKTLFDLRDKRAVTLDIDQISRIEARLKDKRWTLEKNPDGVWDLTLPPPVRADRSSVDNIVSQLRNLSMQAVVSEDKKEAGKYGLDWPTLRVTMKAPQDTQTLVLGKKDGERYDAMNSALDPIFTVENSFLNQFQKDPADLRDKTLFSFFTFDVKHLEVDTPKGHWVFEQQNNKWKETEPKAKDVPTDKMDALLNSIHALRAESFPKASAGDLAAFGLNKPAYSFKVQFGDKKQTETVQAAKVGDKVYARRDTDPLPSQLAATALDDIEKALAAL